MRSFKAALAAIILAASASSAAELFVRSEKARGISMDPFDKAWKKAPAAVIPLVPQTFVTPHGGGSVKSVHVKSLFTPSDLYIQIVWEDSSRNATLDVGGKFSDGCALEFPLREGAPPSPFMGELGHPVNIWQWRAVTEADLRYEKAYSDYYRPGAIHTHVSFSTGSAQSLFAEGFGTITPGEVQDVQAAAAWKDGRWTVVFKRALASEEGTAFREKTALPVAVAIWDGEDQDRNGKKSLSVWHTLVLGETDLPSPATPEERGQKVFSRHGCVTCHGPGGKGGVKNTNAQGGEVPPIYKVRDGFTEEEVEQVIRLGRRSVPDDPAAPLPPLRMNAWGQIMDETEIHDLVKYLWTLAPKSEEW